MFSPINKFYTALIFIYYFLISTGVSYIFFPTKSASMTGYFFLLLPDLKWNQPIYIFTSRGKNVFLGVPYIPLKFVQTALKHPVCVCVCVFVCVCYSMLWWARRSQETLGRLRREHISLNWGLSTLPIPPWQALNGCKGALAPTGTASIIYNRTDNTM